MANYISACRTNYFKVGRPKEFLEWIDTVPDVEWYTKADSKEHPDMIICLCGNNPDGAGWPSWRYSEDPDEEDEELDIFSELAQFLAPGEVAIFEEVGSEKLRYLFGQSIAVRWDGEIMKITLSDMTQRVKEEWGIVPTECTY